MTGQIIGAKKVSRPFGQTEELGVLDFTTARTRNTG